MKERKISFRICEVDYRNLQHQAVMLGGYFKPSGAINISKLCHDLIFEKNINIVKVEGIDVLHETSYHLAKIGRNFNQVIRKIHIDTSTLKQKGLPEEEALIYNYDELQKQYEGLKLVIEEINNQIKNIEEQIS